MTRRRRPTTTAASSIASPTTTVRWAALDTIYRGNATRRRSTRSSCGRAELAKEPAIESALRVQIGELARDQARTARRRDLRLRAGRRDRARRSHGAPALDRLYTKAERWSDLIRLLGELLQRGRPAGEGAGSTSASDWRRSSTIGAAIVRRRWSTSSSFSRARPIIRVPSPCSRGCWTTWRPGAAATLLEPGLRGARGLEVADQDWRDSPAAGRRIRPSGSAGPSGSRAFMKSSWRTSTARSAGTGRSSRRRRRSGRPRSRSCAWRQARSLAGRGEPARQLSRR